MIMLVYWESIAWSIIAIGIVYVKYKNAYKITLMVLNCREFPISPCVLAMIPVYGTADGG